VLPPLQKLAQTRAAWAFEARWSKPQILEAWPNLLPFRCDLVGIDAAARSLAGKAPGALTRAESVGLASLIPAPAASPARVVARACTTQPADCPGLRVTTAAMLGPRNAAPDPGLAPQVAELLLGGDANNGRQVARSTLDAGLQAFVTEVLARRLGSLSARNVRDSAAVVVDTASGDILANVGSAGSASRSGAVDGAAAPRRAGSTLKPFVYGLALERRLLTAASVLDDSPVDLDAASGSTSRRIRTVSFADRSASARRSATASTSPPSARCCSSASMRCANGYTRAATAASRATAVITVSASRSVRLK